MEDSKKDPSSNFQTPSSKSPLVVVVGETASGKSALALELAQRFNGEIICADSRTIYKGMDIGTAKPSVEDQRVIPHHLLDVIAPDQKFSAADFKGQATSLIKDISSRGKLPIMVGGTGLYIDSVLFDYQFSDQVSRERDQQNPRHLKHTNNSDRLKPVRSNTLIIGLQVPKEELEQRIKNRVDVMVQSGFIEEVKQVSDHYGWNASALQAPGYKAFREYLNGAVDLNHAKAIFMKNDLSLAKRQRTWFKRNKSIHWLTGPSKAVDITTAFLNKAN